MMNIKILISLFIIICALAQNDSTRTSNVDDIFSPTNYSGDFRRTFKNEDGEFVSIITGNAVLIYQDMKLEAHEIELHKSTFTVYARAKKDTLETGEVKIIGLPKFTESGTEPMYATRMEYDFKHRRGRVFEGKTTSDKTRYEGVNIRKFGQKTILIRDGKFTTCEEDTPSYWFHSNQIRMLQNDMVFTGPVFMHLHDIPFPVPLPFGVFSLKKGKRSGIEIPTFDFFNNNFKGSGLDNYGYYWAASEKFQATLLGSYYENTGFDWALNTEFKDRYDYSGYVNFSYKKSPLDRNNPKPSETRNNLKLNFKYNQTFDPTFSISTNGSFSSSDVDSRIYKKLEDQLDQNLRSTFDLKKKWGNSGNNLSVNTTYSDNLINKNRSLSFNLTNSWTKSKNTLTVNASNSWNPVQKNHNLTLPNVTFTHQSRELFPSDDPLNASWYNNIRYSYNGKYKETDVRTSSLVSGSEDEYEANESVTRRGIEHTPTLSVSGLKLFKYVGVQPSFTYKETWVDKIARIDHSARSSSGGDTLVVRESNEFAALRQYNVGVTLNTNLYGMIEPKMFGLKAIRHKLTPSIDFRYNPDFTDESYGNGEWYEDSLGNRQFIDKFQFSAFSKTPTGEALNANIRVQNTFTAKVSDDKGEDKKVDLFSLGMNTSVNFLNHGNTRWSDLRTSLTIPSSKYLTFSGNSTHSFYKLDRENGSKIGNEFVFPILKNASFNSTLRLNNGIFSAGKSPKKVSKDTTSNEMDIVKKDLKNKSLEEKIEYMKGFGITWDLNVNANYSYTHYTTGENVVTKYSGTFRTDINLTEKWKLNYNINYDLKENIILGQTFSASRDLGCWTFRFDYSANSYNPYFNLTIAIKEDMLEDLKYERKSAFY